MKKSKINIGIITAFVIIALFNQCQDVRVSREKKEADAIKIETVEVSLEDILTPPEKTEDTDLAEYYTEGTGKTR